MSHTIRDKDRLLARVRRIRGQVEAAQRQLEEEADCSTVLLTVASARGAINGLMSQIIEGHIREHVADPDRQPGIERAKATQMLIDVVERYLK
jgi:FrmR/RcnR family transcriptional regulator, repressor of frmRAB operon